MEIDGLQKFGEVVECLADCFIATIAGHVELLEGMEPFAQAQRYAYRENYRATTRRWTKKEGATDVQKHVLKITKHLSDQGVKRHDLIKLRDKVTFTLRRKSPYFPDVADLWNLAEDLVDNGGKVVDMRGIEGLVKAGIYGKKGDGVVNYDNDEDIDAEADTDDDDCSILNSGQSMLPEEEDDDDSTALSKRRRIQRKK